MVFRSFQSIFSDKSSLILRALVREPHRPWTVRSFLSEGVSLGQTTKTLNIAEQRGYVIRQRKGPTSSTQLVQKELLLEDWTQAYSFEMNTHAYLYDPHGDFLKRCNQFMKNFNIRYALTAFSGSRLIAPYVATERNYLYMDVPAANFEAILASMQTQMGLLKLAYGGNVCFAIPYYKSSIFKHSGIINGFPVVSNLQLYLDLMRLPAGKEEVNYMIETLRKKGENFV